MKMLNESDKDEFDTSEVRRLEDVLSALDKDIEVSRKHRRVGMAE